MFPLRNERIIHMHIWYANYIYHLYLELKLATMIRYLRVWMLLTTCRHLPNQPSTMLDNNWSIGCTRIPWWILVPEQTQKMTLHVTMSCWGLVHKSHCCTVPWVNHLNSQVHWHPVASPSSVNAELDWPCEHDKNGRLDSNGNTQTLFPTKRYDNYIQLLLSIIYSNDIQDHKNNLKLEISSSQVQVLKRIGKNSACHWSALRHRLAAARKNW